MTPTAVNKPDLHLYLNTRSNAIPSIDWAAVDRKALADQANDLRPLRQTVSTSKSRITIMVDDWVLQAYKAKAGGRGYQTLINDTLRKSLDMDVFKESLRQVLREERALAKA